MSTIADFLDDCSRANVVKENLQNRTKFDSVLKVSLEEGRKVWEKISKLNPGVEWTISLESDLVFCHASAYRKGAELMGSQVYAYVSRSAVFFVSPPWTPASLVRIRLS